MTRPADISAQRAAEGAAKCAAKGAAARGARLAAAAARPFRNRRGALSIWAALAAAMGIGIGLFAIDTAKAYKISAQLQAAADAAALAGARALADGEEDPLKTAKAHARKVLAVDGLAAQLKVFRFELGGWTPQDRRFVPKVERPDAIRVSLSRAASGALEEGTAFLPILGRRSWTASATAIAGASDDFGGRLDEPCFSSGIVARGVIAAGADVAADRVCLHGQQGVAFGPGATLSGGAALGMPDPETMLNFGEAAPETLSAALSAPGALTARSLDPGAASRVDELILAYALQSEMTSLSLWRPDMAQPGARIHVHCAEPGVLILPAGIVTDVHLTTNCTIAFQPGARFVNSVIGTTMNAVQGAEVLDQIAADVLGLSPPAGAPVPEGAEEEEDPAGAAPPPAPLDGWAVSGADKVAFGLPDSCAAGGGSLLIADGDVRFGFGMGLHGSTIIAAGDVAMPVQAPGLEGIAVQAGGHVGLSDGSRLKACDGADWLIGLRSVVRLLR